MSSVLIAAPWVCVSRLPAPPPHRQRLQFLACQLGWLSQPCFAPPQHRLLTAHASSNAATPSGRGGCQVLGFCLRHHHAARAAGAGADGARAGEGSGKALVQRARVPGGRQAWTCTRVCARHAASLDVHRGSLRTWVKGSVLPNGAGEQLPYLLPGATAARVCVMGLTSGLPSAGHAWQAGGCRHARGGLAVWAHVPCRPVGWASCCWRGSRALLDLHWVPGSQCLIIQVLAHCALLGSLHASHSPLYMPPYARRAGGGDYDCRRGALARCSAKRRRQRRRSGAGCSQGV